MIERVTETKKLTVPLLPLRDVVVYPHMVIPLFVGRDRSVKALELAMETNKQIFLVAQMNAAEDDPGFDDVFKLGTMANILQLLKLPDGTIKVLVEGDLRAQLLSTQDEEEYLAATVEMVENETVDERELEAVKRSLTTQFDHYVKLNKKIPPEIISSISSVEDPNRLADTIAAHMSIKLDDKQAVLEILDVAQRMEHLIGLMEAEIDLLEVEKRLRGRVKRQMEKSQREYYLNEQMKAIQKELGDLDEGASDFAELEKQIDEAGMSEEAREKADSELKKLKMMSPMSAEATVVRNYLDWLVGIPWKKRNKISRDIEKAEQILNDDHFGLEKVKERILEYLAVQQRVKKLKGPILCLVGPPGVGKTSLGRSIAKATNRKFVRMSLGGVRDEAEIRGHRRTYVGSMPGKIIQNMSKVGTRNPLILLDEIDKMAADFRGDPASALLEVLDPEQNNTFNDHYLEVDYDLSDVMFVTTANSLNISSPLMDRMEIIRISGYTEDEKINIAKNYLLARQMKNNGLNEGELEIHEDALRAIVRYYTREAGVRSIDREIAKICRKVVKQVLSKNDVESIKVTGDNIEEFLGVKRFRYGIAEKEDQVGQVTGLAWTEVGGDLLTIEAAVVAGKGKETFTGQLGDVMQESIKAAVTVVRGRSELLGIESDFYSKNDIHFHVPEGATPKDGPSAGVGMCTALVSTLTGVPVKASVAMTGEITLRGEVLPIGGLKEKLLAALRGGIQTVLIPHDNERDLAEIPENIKDELEIIPVQWIDDVLKVALQHMPTPDLDDGVPQKSLGQDATKETEQDKKEIRPH
jgi:ATP-dependent Lon protease